MTVTAEDGTSQQSYTITVTRGPSDDATLSTLSLAGDAAIILTPAFDPATTGYTAEVANTVESISLTAQANHDGASVSVMDADGASIPDTAQIDFQYGENIISIVVTAQDGTTTMNYQVTVTRSLRLAHHDDGGRETHWPSPKHPATPHGERTWAAFPTERMELNGTRHRVLSLMRYAGGLYLNINRALPGDFTLTVGGQDFPGRGERRTPDTGGRTLLVGCQQHQLDRRRPSGGQHSAGARLREPPRKAAGTTHSPVQESAREP